uniref:Sushi domain-containing protein n=1 Tax=Pygocentrus nattereri TaxID=42514 RepID=A0AAR2L569_PYGNA
MGKCFLNVSHGCIPAYTPGTQNPSLVTLDNLWLITCPPQRTCVYHGDHG